MEPVIYCASFLDFFCPRQPDWDKNFVLDLNDALESTSNARAWTMGLEESSQRFFT